MSNENNSANDFAYIAEHNKAMQAYREKFGHDCDYNLTSKDIYALIYPNSTLIAEEPKEGGVLSFMPEDSHPVQENENIPFPESDTVDNSIQTDSTRPAQENGVHPLEKPTREYQEHEKRVIEESRELHDRTHKLFDFVNSNPIFTTLSPQVQFLRKAQLFHMHQYLAMLNEIIYLFDGNEELPITDGQETIGMFGTDKSEVFDLKYISMMMIDATNHYGNDPRRNAVVRTDMEKVQMMAVKSVFSKNNKKQ
jgi:hypothetical protein